MKKNIVVFGGSFDPIHRGHISLVQNMCLAVPNLSNFYIIPTGDHPESKQHLFSGEERLLMIKSCFGQLTPNDLEKIHHHTGEKVLFEAEYTHPSLISSDIELNKISKSYTLETLNMIKSKHANANIHLLIGADQAEKFSLWYRSKEIVQIAQLWTFPRKECFLDPNFEWNILDVEEQNISSTFIRELLKNNNSLIHKYIPDSVKQLASYFFKRGLNK